MTKIPILNSARSIHQHLNQRRLVWARIPLDPALYIHVPMHPGRALLLGYSIHQPTPQHHTNERRNAAES